MTFPFLVIEWYVFFWKKSSNQIKNSKSEENFKIKFDDFRRNLRKEF